MKTGLIKLGQAYIAGVKFADYEKLKDTLQFGDALSLTWEIDNQYDTQAIRIDYKGIKLGYIPRGNLQLMIMNKHHAGARVVCTIINHDKEEETHKMFYVEVFCINTLKELRLTEQ